jgi:hypothetical protein
MKSRLAWFIALAAVSVGALSCNKESGPVREAVSNKDGGLNRSTQHSGRTQLALKTKAKSLAGVRLAETLPWLDFDRVEPNRSLRPVKHYRINALDGVASTG